MNRLHPATMIVAFLPKLYDAFRQVLPFVALSFFTGKGDRTELFIAAIGVLGGFGAIAAYLTTRYGIEEGNLVCTSGWLFKRDRRIPLDQIQNVNVKQGLLERFLKVVTLEVETAAGTGAEMKLQVVTEQAADELRGTLSSQTRNIAPAANRLVEEPIYGLSKKDLLFGAMTENQGGFIVFGLLGTIGGAAIVQVGFKFIQLRELIPPWVVWVIGMGITGAILLAGWVYGAIQYWIKYGAFAVRAEPGMFRISHGLLTKLQYTVRLNRVEIATVTTTLWQRLTGRCAVYVGTAGSFGEAGAMAPVALMAPLSQSQDILHRVLPDFDASKLDWQRYPPYYLWIQILRSMFSVVLFGSLAAGAEYFSVVKPTFHFMALALLALAILPLVGILWTVAFGFRKMAYAISGNYIATRTGVFRKSTQYMPIHRIDTVGTVEPPWWRRRGVTKATANAMVHSLAFGMVPKADAEKLSQLIVDRPAMPTGFTLDLASGRDL